MTKSNYIIIIAFIILTFLAIYWDSFSSKSTTSNLVFHGDKFSVYREEGLNTSCFVMRSNLTNYEVGRECWSK